MRSRSNRFAAHILMLMLLLLMSLALNAQGKGNGVEVRVASATMVESEPGKIISASFLVTNKTGTRQEFQESLSLPTDWQSVGPVTTTALDPGEQQVRVIAVSVPIAAVATSYKVTYSLRSLKNYGVQDADSVLVIILPVSQIETLVEEKPEKVIAGDTFKVKLRLVNRGNTEVVLAIKANSTQSFPIRLQPAEITLRAGGSETLVAEVKTDRNLKRRTQEALQFEFSGAKQPVAGTTVCAEIIPNATDESEQYNRIQSRIRLLQAVENGGSGFQTEFSGAGVLDEAGSKSIEFLIRAPDISRISPYGQKDEAYLNYSTKALDVRLGDQSYGLSQLTDYYRYGRGAGMKIKGPGNLDFGAFHVEQRWQTLGLAENAVYADKQFNDHLNMRVNLLGKDESIVNGGAKSIWSIETNAKMVANSNIQMEFAGSHSKDTGSDSAYRIAIDGNIHESYYSAGKIHADPGFGGYYKDTDYTSFNISMPFTPALHARYSANRWEQNINRNPAESSAPMEDFRRIGLEYVSSHRDTLTLDYDRFRRQDMLEVSTFNSDERFWSLGWGRNFGNQGLQLTLQSGNVENALENTTRNATRYSIYYYARPSSGQYYSVFAQIGDTATQDARLIPGSNTIGASGNWLLSDRMSLGVQCLVNGLNSETMKRSNQYYLTTSYEEYSGHIWTLRLRKIDHSFGDDDTSGFLSYIIPWDMPVSRKRSSGVIIGLIYDAEHDGKPGIARAIVTAGKTTVAASDSGEFRLSGVPAGPCSLSVDTSAAGLGMVSQTKLPMLVEIKGGETKKVEIGFVRSSKLRGRVGVYAHNQGSLADGGFYVQGTGESSAPSGTTNLTQVNGLSGVLVEMTNGTETTRRVTDNKGEFSFEDLRPGRWTVKAYDYNLPAAHYLEQAETEVDLKPGQSAETTFRVLPKLRPVTIIEQGTLVSTKP